MVYRSANKFLFLILSSYYVVPFDTQILVYDAIKPENKPNENGINHQRRPLWLYSGNKAKIVFSARH